MNEDDTPSVSTVDNDAERLEEARAVVGDWCIETSTRELARESYAALYRRVAAALDSRDAALREVREERDQLRVKLREARGEVFRQLEKRRALGDPSLAADVPFLDAELARSQPATPSPQEVSIVEAFVKDAYEKTGGPTPELRRAYKAYVDNQATTPSPVPIQQQDIGSSVTANGDNDGEQPLPDTVERAREIRETFEWNIHQHVENYGDIYPLNFSRRLALEAIDAIIGVLVSAQACPAAKPVRQDTVEVTDESKQHSSVSPDDHEVGQPSPDNPYSADHAARRFGKRDGLRWAITWLHRRAESMNDPQATAILNSAAFSLGNEIREGRMPPIPEQDPATVAPDSTPQAVTDENDSTPDSEGGWRPIAEGCPPENEICDFWLEWAIDCGPWNQPLPWTNEARFFRGKDRCWSSIHTAIYWRPTQPLPAPPSQEQKP